MLTAASGSFQSPGWPNGYPREDFQCEWIIELPNTGAIVELTVDDSAYGINGRDPCSDDYIDCEDNQPHEFLTPRSGTENVLPLLNLN